jgi:hypothetical protein
MEEARRIIGGDLKQPPITDHQIIDLVGELTHLLIRKKVVVRAILLCF